MGEGAAQLVREEGSGDRRVRVPVGDHEIRRLHDRCDLAHRRRDLKVRALPLQLELMIGLAQFHFAEEDPIHHEVVVLPRMDQHMVIAQGVEGLDHRRHFDDFRAGADDRYDPTHGTRCSSNRGRY